MTIISNGSWTDDWDIGPNGWSNPAIYEDDCGPTNKYHGVWATTSIK